MRNQYRELRSPGAEAMLQLFILQPLFLLIGTAGLLDIANAATENFLMHGRVIKMDGEREIYKRRLDLAKKLIRESKRTDWALKTGMLNEDDLEEINQESQSSGDPAPESVDENVSGGIVNRTTGGSEISKASVPKSKVTM